MNDRRAHDTRAPRSIPRWVGPLVLTAAIVVPIAVLVASNPDSVPVRWAGLEWTAPLWLVLALTFVAGAVLTPLFGWFLRRYGRRRARRSEERRVQQRAASEAERTLRAEAETRQRARDDDRTWG